MDYSYVVYYSCLMYKEMRFPNMDYYGHIRIERRLERRRERLELSEHNGVDSTIRMGNGKMPFLIPLYVVQAKESLSSASKPIDSACLIHSNQAKCEQWLQTVRGYSQCYCLLALQIYPTVATAVYVDTWEYAEAHNSHVVVLPLYLCESLDGPNGTFGFLRY